MDPVCGHSKIAPPPPSLQHFERDLEILILDHSKIAPHPPPRSLQLVERDLEILNFFKILNIDHLKINLAPLSLQQFEGVLKIFGHSAFLYMLCLPPLSLSSAAAVQNFVPVSKKLESWVTDALVLLVSLELAVLLVLLASHVIHQIKRC